MTGTKISYDRAFVINKRSIEVDSLVILNLS